MFSIIHLRTITYTVSSLKITIVPNAVWCLMEVELFLSTPTVFESVLTTNFTKVPNTNTGTLLSLIALLSIIHCDTA